VLGVSGEVLHEEERLQLREPNLHRLHARWAVHGLEMKALFGRKEVVRMSLDDVAILKVSGDLIHRETPRRK
jgi:hypothetical protein